MKKPLFEAMLVIVATGILTGALMVACAPTHESSSKDNPGAPSAALTANAPSGASSSLLSGDWICKNDENCSYSLISISFPNGLGGPNGPVGQEGKVTLSKPSLYAYSDTQNSAQITVSTESAQLHIVMKTDDITPASLAGDLEVHGGQDELVINGEHYVRKSG